MDKLKLIAFDVDGTLTEGNIWQRVNKVAGVTPEEDLKYYTLYYEHKITFEEWAKSIIKIYKANGKTRKEFEKVLTRVPLVPHAAEIVKQLRKKYQVCLVSNGIDTYVENVANKLSIALYFGSYNFIYDSKNKIVDIGYQAPEAEAKIHYLNQLVRENNIRPEEIVFVGDSSNDLEAFRFTKHGILVGRGNEILKKASWRQVDSLEQVLSILL